MTSTTSVSLETFTRRTVRAWWTDGLWDFAVVGFLLIAAGWAYILIRVAAFPTWTWPWPFITDEVVNPMQTQFTAWMIGVIPVMMAYTWLAFKLVDWLKANVLASRQGYVRHGFWLKVEPRFYILYIGIYLAMWGVLIVVAQMATGSGRLVDMTIIAAMSAVTLTLGSVYGIRRYLVVSVLGLAACVWVELFLTTTASYMEGPRSFFDVPGQMGNPAIPLLVWAALFLITGAYGLVSVMRRELVEGAV